MTPSPARVDAEYAAYADQLGADSQREAQRCLDQIAEGLEVSYHRWPTARRATACSRPSKSWVPTCWSLGSSSDGALGQVVLGSTTDWLLHSSPVPVAISPRGYRGSQSASWPGSPARTPAHRNRVRVVERVAALTAQLDVADAGDHLRRPRPHDVPAGGRSARRGLDPARPGRRSCARCLAKLKSDGVVGDDVALQVVTGNGWDQALDAAEWEDGELLALGTIVARAASRRVPGLPRREDHPAQPGAGAGAARA